MALRRTGRGRLVVPSVEVEAGVAQLLPTPAHRLGPPALDTERAAVFLIVLVVAVEVTGTGVTVQRTLLDTAAEAVDRAPLIHTRGEPEEMESVSFHGCSKEADSWRYGHR